MDAMEVAKLAAQEGGDIVARYFRDGVTIRSKESYNLVSDADVESEQAIVAAIKRSFPSHEILGEEAYSETDATRGPVWVIDPLDGTNNFAHNIPHFAVSIAYCEDGVPQVGAVFNPVRDDWYIAERGKGSFHNGVKVSVADHSDLNQTFVGVGFYYDRGSMMEATLESIKELFKRDIHGIRRFGTASLDLAQVGTGCFGAYFEYTLSAWDFAAGQLFVEEAGGRVTTCQGDPIPLAKSSLLASNGKLHSSVLEIVRQHETSTRT